jgi:DNA-binding NarL/FixJ family response regulator
MTSIMLLQSLDREMVIDAFCGGARGVLSRADSFQSLAKCIRCVHNGEIWANNAQIEFLLEALPNSDRGWRRLRVWLCSRHESKR